MTVNEANQYVEQNRDKVNDAYRHNYHVMAPVGWINDPNGFCFYKDEYHLFYQYYPYDVQWGASHWGHVKSKDLIKWEELPVALAPDQRYDSGGCFSGTAIQIGDELYLMYTGHTDPDKNNSEAVRQVQCLAKSSDGIVFEKLDKNPVISSDKVPENTRVQDFRDPRIWRYKEKYYVAIGSRTKDNKGQILFYTSNNLTDWQYLNNFIITDQDFGSVWECPDVFTLGNKDIVIISSQHFPQMESGTNNIHECIALIGKFNFEVCDFKMETYQLLDSGFDFYAPQTLITKDGRRVLIAWMDMWERKSPLNELKHNWRGALTLPRELFIKDDGLFQQPIREINNYRKNAEFICNMKITDEIILENIKPKSHEFLIELENMRDKILNIDLFKNRGDSLRLTVDGYKQEIVLDRSKIGYPIETFNKPNDYYRSQSVSLMDKGVKLNIFIDKSSVEVFINDGEYVMTSLVYPRKEGCIAFSSDKPVMIEKFSKWEILV